jgi:hypothetical protein
MGSMLTVLLYYKIHAMFLIPRNTYNFRPFSPGVSGPVTALGVEPPFWFIRSPLSAPFSEYLASFLPQYSASFPPVAGSADGQKRRRRQPSKRVPMTMHEREREFAVIAGSF